MITLSENGFPKGHQPNCACPACRGHQAAEERRAREAEQARAVRAVARLGVWMAAQHARASGRSAPDVIRAALDGDALDTALVLKMAGVNPEPAAAGAAGWQGDAPSRPAQSSDFWSQFPEHDPRFLSGTPAEQAAVVAEYEGRRLEAQRRSDDYYNRTGAQVPNRQDRPMPTPPPMAFAPRDERGVPVQVSRAVPGSEGSA